MISRECIAREAYSVRSMPRTLENLTQGTAVLCGETRVGAVLAVYAEGETRSAALIVVDWSGRPAPVSLPANEVMTIDERGVVLMNADPAYYGSLVEFDASRFPTVHKIS
jgi:hypothetical protein